jgi:hypothetical protein
MRHSAPLILFASVCWGDATVPRGDASAARGGPDARRLDGAAAAATAAHAKSHRLAGPRALDGAGRPVCTSGARGAADPSCGADERTMLDWLPEAR